MDVSTGVEGEAMSELDRVGNHHRKVVAGLEREIAQLVHDRNEWMVKAGKATALASQYLRERDALRDELKRYGVHGDYCSCMTPSGAGAGPCDCGFRDVLKREE